MRVHDLLITGALCAAIGLMAACSDTRRTTATAMTDDQMEDAINARIRADAELRGYDIEVDANASENKVTLSGDVPSQNLRSRAVELAKAANAGITVTDEIDVKPTEVARADYTDDMGRQERERAKGTGDKIGDNLDDAWIHTKVRTKLVGAGEAPFGGINVDVVDNVVTLRGNVDSQQTKAEAERIAKQTEGVAEVRNLLRVGG